LKGSKKAEGAGAARRRRVPVILIILLVLVLAAVVILVDSNTRLVTTEFGLYYGNLPAAFDGYRIVVLSDIHAAEIGKGNETLIDIVSNAKPDMIAITGDLIDKVQAAKPVWKQLEIAGQLIEGLTPIAPVYYVTGNHEWDSGEIWSLLALLEEKGVHVLRNNYTLLESGGETIILAGTDDPNGPADMVKPRKFIRGIFDAEGEGFTVVLTHRNSNLDLYGALGVDLVLCGHAHGGLIRLPFTDGLIGPRLDFFPTHTNGLYTAGGTNMVVSRGVGNHMGWTRFLNNPQVVVVELRRA